jgi:hypothetical protein
MRAGALIRDIDRRKGIQAEIELENRQKREENKIL